MVMWNLIGQFGPLVGTRLYPVSDGPCYAKGMAVCGGFMLLVARLTGWLKGIVAWENGKGGQGEEGAMDEESLIDGHVREKGLYTVAQDFGIRAHTARGSRFPCTFF